MNDHAVVTKDRKYIRHIGDLNDCINICNEGFVVVKIYKKLYAINIIVGLSTTWLGFHYNNYNKISMGFITFKLDKLYKDMYDGDEIIC